MLLRIVIEIDSKKSREILEALLTHDAAVLNIYAYPVEKPRPIAAKVERKRKSPVKKMEEGKSSDIVLAIIEQTVHEGHEFTPRQIKSVANARDVKDGSFYGALITLCQQKKIEKVEVGRYKRL